MVFWSRLYFVILCRGNHRRTNRAMLNLPLIVRGKVLRGDCVGLKL